MSLLLFLPFAALFPFALFPPAPLENHVEEGHGDREVDEELLDALVAVGVREGGQKSLCAGLGDAVDGGRWTGTDGQTDGWMDGQGRGGGWRAWMSAIKKKRQ